MRRLVALVLATSAMLAASIAAADDAEVPFALSVNTPTSWGIFDDWPRGYGASAYVGLAKHHGVRANVAVYDWGTFAGGIESETSYSGRMFDVAIGHQWFSRRLWDGFSLDTDLLLRRKNIRVDETSWSNDATDTRSTTVAARMMVGWTWALSDHAIMSLASGFAYGIEHGRETVYQLDDDTFDLMLDSTADVTRDVLTFEAMLRFGGAFR